MYSYDSYRYHAGMDHHDHQKYPYDSGSYAHSYYPNPVRSQFPGPKKKFGVTHGQQIHTHHSKNGGATKPINQVKGGFNATSSTGLPITNPISPEEISEKSKQLRVPIHDEDEPSQAINSSQYYPGTAFIPLIEEEDQEGYEEPYSLHNTNNQRQSKDQGFATMGPLNKGDSPSNYRPFGTHFGPRILNRYGGHADFLTPQAKHVMPHQYVNLPGDTSSKSSPFQKSLTPVSKTQPVLSLGFSSLAEQVVKSQVTSSENKIGEDL